jgi:hypothetical protein
MRTHTWLALLLTAVAVGCGNSNSTNMTDAAVAADMTASSAKDMAVRSRCGRPGDVGTANGVGKYCGDDIFGTCTGQKANLCSALGNDPDHPEDDTFFCTFTCTPADMGAADPCGAGASCQCESQGCACAPDSCTGNGVTDGGTGG